MNAWDVTDTALFVQAVPIHTALTASPDWEIRLFKNDYTPVPGMVIGDLVEADFPGYSMINPDPAEWDGPNTVDHVVSVDYLTPLVWTADPTGFASQIIYGYYVISNFGDLWWAERFNTPREMFPDDILRLTPSFRTKTLPYI